MMPFMTLVAQAADPTFANDAFKNKWVAQDRLVGVPGVSRPYTWGPSVPEAPNAISEPYNSSPGGQRLVQYFDKARMEINNPGGNPSDPFYVTTGLVVKELVSGLRQVGDTSFVQFNPSKTQVAGDPVSVNPDAPTYESFKNVVTLGNPDANSRPNAVGSTVTQFINKAGQVSPGNPQDVVTIGAYDTHTNHNIAAPFWTFITSSGPVTDPATGARVENSPVYTEQPLERVFGYPIAEPFWVVTKVGGVSRNVLVQLFERRTLTYNPAITGASKVEMGNVGQHYYQWRYVEPQTSPTPTTPPPPPPAPSDFSQFRASYLKSGAVPQGGTGNVLSYPTGAGASNSSALYDPDKKLAIVGTAGGGVVGVDVTNFNTPTQAWRFSPTGVNFDTTPVLYNGVVYYGGGDGKVYAIKESDGTQVWASTVAGSAIPSSVVVDTDSAYFTAADGKLYAINLNDGTPKWQAQATGTNLVNLFSPIIVNNTIYVVGSDNKVYAFNKDGSQVATTTWNSPALDGSVVARPSYANGRFYVGTSNGTLYALNGNGTIQSQHTFTATKAIYSTPAIASVGTGTRVYVGTDDGKVYGLDATNLAAAPVWTFTVGAAVRTSPAVVDGFVYFGAQDNKVYRVEASNAANSAVLATAGAVFDQNSPIVNSGYLVINTSAGILHIIK